MVTVQGPSVLTGVWFCPAGGRRGHSVLMVTSAVSGQGGQCRQGPPTPEAVPGIHPDAKRRALGDENKAGIPYGFPGDIWGPDSS